jgi:hypothetical protein
MKSSSEWSPAMTRDLDAIDVKTLRDNLERSIRIAELSLQKQSLAVGRAYVDGLLEGYRQSLKTLDIILAIGDKDGTSNE